jgi:histidyl-tRNA synthetase
MVPDSEILRIIVEVAQALKLDITIKLNHRRILDGMLAIAGCPQDKIRAISSSIDKLDKADWLEGKSPWNSKYMLAKYI